MVFSSSTLAALIVGGVLSIVIPLAALIVLKLKRRNTSLIPALIGIGTFIVFALMLEQLFHTVMLPIVRGNSFVYLLYGALAAGVFEETGRFIANKLLMKNNYSTENAIMMGIGHGGCEAVAVLGITLFTFAACGFMVNDQGIDEVVKTLSASDPAAAGTITAQLEQVAAYNFGTMALGIYERIIAMVFHIAMSVVVYKAASTGKTALFPAAILLHAAFDFPVGLYQTGAVSLTFVYIYITIFAAASEAFAIHIAKKYPDGGEFV